MKLLKHKYFQFALLILVGLLIGVALPNSSNENNSNQIEASHQHDGLWSCSMHPQIVSETPGSCPICGMDLTPMEDTAEGIDPNAIVLTEDAAKNAQVYTYTISASNQSDQTIDVSGTLIPNLDSQYNEISYVSGRIDYLAHPSSGVKIQKGSLIAKMYSPELIAAQQELISLSKIKDSEEQLFKAVVQKFLNWNFSNHQIESIIKEGVIQQSFPIYAKQTGTITKVNSQQGEWIKKGQALLTSVDLNVIWADLEVSENDIDLFKEGQNIELIIEALGHQKRTAIIDFVDPIMDKSKRIGKLRASLTNKDNRLKPGMFIGATASLKSSSQSIQIPSSSVLWTGKQSLVYIKSPTAPTYTLREVELLKRQGEWYTIASGVELGEEIVQNGTFIVDAAAQLAGKTSMINQQPSNNSITHKHN